MHACWHTVKRQSLKGGINKKVKNHTKMKKFKIWVFLLMFKEIKGNHKKQAQKEKIMTNTETDLEKN